MIGNLNVQPHALVISVEQSDSIRRARCDERL
jgi:hypothetical protein